ncbi:MAG TPA: nucleoside monophosphate kinase [Verrucomicrobiae bacterium]|jgi:adenylate kinase|nr:nucleoside monophosphate kinase [Verrucomicrobiae bacterium]
MKLNHDRTAWLKGGAALCHTPPRCVETAFRLILLGAPGVGKGTQAELLSDRLGACHLSTGDVFRAAKCAPTSAQSPAMQSAFDAMRCGDLVGDEIVLAVVRERARCLRCSGGFLLDGFPRTVVQAAALENLLNWERIPLTGVVNYELPIDVIVARLSGRRTCAKCKSVFHLVNHPPQNDGVCDHCAGPLIQREDDRPEAVRVRMAAFQKSVQPLVDFYQQRGLLLSVPAEGSPEAIFERTLAALHLPTSAQAVA